MISWCCRRVDSEVKRTLKGGVECQGETLSPAMGRACFLVEQLLS